MVASLFEFSVAAEHCAGFRGEGNQNPEMMCTARDGFAVALGVISFVICIVQIMFLRMESPAGIACGRPIAIALVTLWGCAAGVNTSFNGPFNTPFTHGTLPHSLTPLTSSN
jgi:hypothetical protein